MTPTFRWFGIGVNGWPVHLYVADVAHVAAAYEVLRRVVPARIVALTPAERRSS